MRLVLRRAASGRPLLVAAALVAALTTVLVTTFLQYAELLPSSGARAILAAAPPLDRALVASGGGASTPGEVSARDAAVRRLVAPGWHGVPVDVAMAGYASGQRLPDDLFGTTPDADGTYAVVAFLDALPDHADLVTGAWPEPVPAGQPARVAIPEGVARELGLDAGDTLPVTDERLRRPGPVEVVGVFRPRDPAEPYWELAAGPLRAGGYGPLVVHRDEFLARYLSLSTLDWVATPALAEVTTEQLARLGVTADRLSRERAETLGLDPSTRIRTGLPELTAALTTATLVTRSGLLLPALLFTVIAGYGLLLIARLLADHRRDEHALLRARGAARTQLARFAAAEALLVVAPAALLGPPLAAHLLRTLDHWSARDALPLLAGPAPLGPDTFVGPVGSGTAWTIAGAAALGCAVALVLPAWRRGGTWVAEQQSRSRPARTVWASRAGVDIALVAVALLAGAQLRRYASPLTRTADGASERLGIDPLLVAAPTLGVLAATVISLRLLPTVTRWAVRTAGRRGSFSRLLGLWQADRRPHAGPVLLLVLAVAAGTLAVCVAATWQRSQGDQAIHRVGADLRAALPSAGSGPPAGTDLARLPGVAASMAVDRGQVSVGGERTATLLAIDAAAAGAVVRLRPDLAAGKPDELFGRLAQGRRQVPGPALPAQARRLAGEVSVAAGGAGERVSPDALVAYVDDGSGVVRSVPLGQPEAGRLAFDVPLPAAAAGTAPVRLLGLAGHARISRDDRISGNLAGPPRGFVGTADWRWSALSIVDASGARTPFAVPPEWTVVSDASTSAATTWVAVGSGFVARTAVSARFLLADPVFRPQPVPALVTPHVLTAAGAAVGDTVSLDGSPAGAGIDVTVVGLLDSMPSTEDGAGVAVDLPTLAAYRFATRAPAAIPDEWWLAAEPGARERAATAAAARGLVVTDRFAEAQRLLDDPLGSGVLVALYAAVLAGTALAVFGLVIDARATALRRSGELAVLHTLGASPAALARALVVEQSVLAGLGVAGGVAAGIAVAATMGPSLVPTASGARPVPEPLLSIPAPVALPAVALFAAALVLGAAVARRARRDVVAGLLRIGADR